MMVGRICQGGWEGGCVPEATILKHYAKLPEVVMRRFVENGPVILSERV